MTIFANSKIGIRRNFVPLLDIFTQFYASSGTFYRLSDYGSANTEFIAGNVENSWQDSHPKVI